MIASAGRMSGVASSCWPGDRGEGLDLKDSRNALEDLHAAGVGPVGHEGPPGTRTGGGVTACGSGTLSWPRPGPGLPVDGQGPGPGGADGRHGVIRCRGPTGKTTTRSMLAVDPGAGRRRPLLRGGRRPQRTEPRRSTRRGRCSSRRPTRATVVPACPARRRGRDQRRDRPRGLLPGRRERGRPGPRSPPSWPGAGTRGQSRDTHGDGGPMGAGAQGVVSRTGNLRLSLQRAGLRTYGEDDGVNAGTLTPLPAGGGQIRPEGQRAALLPNAAAAVSRPAWRWSTPGRRGGLREFEGPAGSVPRVARGAEFYDDYAHHPTEVVATLRSLPRRAEPVAVFQPHRYSRTRRCGGPWASRPLADVVVVTDV